MTTGEPPNDPLAEQAVLGAMLLSKDAIPQVTGILTAADFYRPAHALIFTAIVALASAGEPVDPVTVAGKLRESGTLKRAGEETYLLTLYQTPPSGSNAAHYAKTVASLSRGRRVRELGLRLQQLTEGSAVEDLDLAVGEGEKLFRDMHKVSPSVASFDESVAAWEAEQIRSDNAFPTPWRQLNDMLNGGLRPGRCYVFAARPGIGKSNALLNIALFAALRDNPALIFSMEMGKTEVMDRLVANGSEVDYGTILRRKMDMAERGKVDAFLAESQGMPLSIVDQEAITVEQIVSHVRANKDVRLVFIDYLQLVEGSDRRASSRDQVTHISRSLKVAARQLGVVFVIAAQLNRNSQNGKDGKPRPPLISDIGESGAVERDADAVVLLHQDDSEDGTVTRMIVGKNRTGRKGSIELTTYGRFARLG